MKTILFQGDSITDCSRIREEKTDFITKLCNKLGRKTLLGNGYPALVAAELGARDKDLQFINRGVSGDRIPDVYARIVKDIIKIKPDYMSLLVGVNDVWQEFDRNNGTGASRFEKVYEILIQELQEELPDMKIIILEPFVLEGSATRNRENQPNRYELFRRAIIELAAIEKRLAEKYNLCFVPLQSVFDEAAEKAAPEALLSDGVHPTEKGHVLIKNEWLKAYKTL